MVFIRSGWHHKYGYGSALFPPVLRELFSALLAVAHYTLTIGVALGSL